MLYALLYLNRLSVACAKGSHSAYQFPRGRYADPKCVTTRGGVFRCFQRIVKSGERRMKKNRDAHSRSRRRFLIGGAAVVGAGAAWGTWRLVVAPPPAHTNGWPRYFLRHQQDELFLELTAIGFREIRRFGQRWLTPRRQFPQPLLVFTFAPQHFAETAIATRNIPAVFQEDQLSKIELLASWRTGERRNVRPRRSQRPTRAELPRRQEWEKMRWRGLPSSI